MFAILMETSSPSLPTGNRSKFSVIAARAGVNVREALEPFAAGKALYLKIRSRALANGLICYPSGGNVDGIKGDTIIMAPPYNASDAELTEIAARLAKSLRQALTDIGA